MWFLIQFFHGIAIAVDVAAMSLLALAFFRGAWGWIGLELRRTPWDERVGLLRKLRCVLATHILFALELMIVTDLIGTVLILIEHSPEGEAFLSSPVFYELAQLAMVVLIRTFIDYYLSREIKGLEESEVEKADIEEA